MTANSNASYTYDYNGNTLTKVVGSNTTSYTWDYENRLIQVTLPGSGGSVYFKYDSLGRRIYKSSLGGTSVYAYDGDNLIEETNSSGTAVARYAHALNIDQPLALLRSSATSYYNADGLGSITSLANGSGSPTQTYTYDSFGKVTASSGSVVNPFQYGGREFDAETALYYYRARYYDANAGKFLSEDPSGFWGGDANLYRYVQNNPIVFSDPIGLATVINNTGSPVLVVGGLGPGFGHGGNDYNYAVVPPVNDAVAGGQGHPLPAYPSAQAALDAYYHRGPAVDPVGELLDIDRYWPTPVSPNTICDLKPGKNTDDNTTQIHGDDKGPNYTLLPMNGRVTSLPYSDSGLGYAAAGFRKLFSDIW
jgi:RHS repeat-associated protein